MTRDEARELIIKAVNEAISADGTVGAAYMQALAGGWQVSMLSLVVDFEEVPVTLGPSGIEKWSDEEFLRLMGIRGGVA